MRISSPCLSVSVIVATSASTALPASALVRPARSATAAISSAWFIINLPRTGCHDRQFLLPVPWVRPGGKAHTPSRPRSGADLGLWLHRGYTWQSSRSSTAVSAGQRTRATREAPLRPRDLLRGWQGFRHDRRG